MSRSVFNYWMQVCCAVGVVAVVLVPTSRGQVLEWRPSEDAIATADSANRFVMVAVHAPWCGWCHKMKRDVYPSVRSCLADDFVVARLNRDDTETTYRYQGRRMTPRELASTFRVDGVPATVLLSPQGEYLLHLSGFIEPRHLRPVLVYISTGAYRRTSYEDFRADPVSCGDTPREGSD